MIPIDAAVNVYTEEADPACESCVSGFFDRYLY